MRGLSEIALIYLSPSLPLSLPLLPLQILTSARSTTVAASTDAWTPGDPTTVNATRGPVCTWTGERASVSTTTDKAAMCLRITISIRIIWLKHNLLSSYQHTVKVARCVAPIQEKSYKHSRVGGVISRKYLCKATSCNIIYCKYK